MRSDEMPITLPESAVTTSNAISTDRCTDQDMGGSRVLIAYRRPSRNLDLVRVKYSVGPSYARVVRLEPTRLIGCPTTDTIDVSLSGSSGCLRHRGRTLCVLAGCDCQP
jgi:hypothetical protein